MEAKVTYKQKFHYPLEKVFDAFSNPEVLMQWFGPKNAKMISAECNFINGGNYKFLFSRPGGNEFSILGEYLEIIRNKKIIISFGYEGIPQTFGYSIVSFHFSSVGDSTEISLLQEFSITPLDIAGRTDSWNFMFHRLSEILQFIND